jgi:predicted nucleic acid-binding Zn ribbon protein
MTEDERPQPIADVVARYLKRTGLARRVEAAGIVAEWPALVGPQIAAVTEPEAVTADGILWVRVATAPWAQELGMMTPRILGKLNQGRTGRVRQIRWVAAPPPRPPEP